MLVGGVVGCVVMWFCVECEVVMCGGEGEFLEEGVRYWC